MTQQTAKAMGPLANDNERDPLTPNCLAMLYNAPVRTAGEAAGMHTVSLDKSLWKCVKAVKEDVTMLRPSHMTQGSAVGLKLIAMRKITVTEPAIAWERRQFYVPELLIRDLASSWADLEAHVLREFAAESNACADSLLVRLAPADKVIVADGRMAISAEDLQDFMAPMKEQGGLFMSRGGGSLGPWVPGTQESGCEWRRRGTAQTPVQQDEPRGSGAGATPSQRQRNEGQRGPAALHEQGEIADLCAG